MNPNRFDIWAQIDGRLWNISTQFTKDNEFRESLPGVFQDRLPESLRKNPRELTWITEATKNEEKKFTIFPIRI